MFVNSAFDYYKSKDGGTMREKKEINIQIGERIRATRESAGITQENLSERIEVTAQYVSDLERGVVGVSIQTLKKLCIALGTTSDFLLFGKEDNERNNVIINRCRGLSDKNFRILCEIIDKYNEALS